MGHLKYDAYFQRYMQFHIKFDAKFPILVVKKMSRIEKLGARWSVDFPWFSRHLVLLNATLQKVIVSSARCTKVLEIEAVTQVTGRDYLAIEAERRIPGGTNFMRSHWGHSLICHLNKVCISVIPGTLQAAEDTRLRWNDGGDLFANALAREWLKVEIIPRSDLQPNDYVRCTWSYAYKKLN